MARHSSRYLGDTRVYDEQADWLDQLHHDDDVTLLDETAPVKLLTRQTFRLDLAHSRQLELVAAYLHEAAETDSRRLDVIRRAAVVLLDYAGEPLLGTRLGTGTPVRCERCGAIERSNRIAPELTGRDVGLCWRCAQTAAAERPALQLLDALDNLNTTRALCAPRCGCSRRATRRRTKGA